MIIKEPQKAKQLVCFDGLYLEGRNGHMNVWPTDIDGFIQLDFENLFIFLELKFGNSTMKYGQQKALTSLADAIGENAYVLLVEHNIKNPKTPIIVKDALVRSIYRGKMGWITCNETVQETVGKIIKVRKDVLKAWKT